MFLPRILVVAVSRVLEWKCQGQRGESSAGRVRAASTPDGSGEALATFSSSDIFWVWFSSLLTCFLATQYPFNKLHFCFYSHRPFLFIITQNPGLISSNLQSPNKEQKFQTPRVEVHYFCSHVTWICINSLEAIATIKHKHISKVNTSKATKSPMLTLTALT